MKKAEGGGRSQGVVTGHTQSLTYDRGKTAHTGSGALGDWHDHYLSGVCGAQHWNTQPLLQ